MKIANRMIVFAVSAIAFGTMAFGQTTMTAKIPFAFRTAGATLPAGTYQLSTVAGGARSNVILLRNAATQQTAFAGTPMVDSYKKAADAPVAVFVCSADGCALKAIRTASGTLEYNVPKSKDPEKAMAVLEIPMATHIAD